MDEFMAAAIDEARAGLEEGGHPIGSVLVKDGAILGRGRNTWFQNADPTGHAEMEAYRDAARRAKGREPLDGISELIQGASVYTTMMPCEMCAGAIIRFGAKRVVVGETATYDDAGTQALMERQGIEVAVLHSAECIALVEEYLRRYPERRRAIEGRPAPPLVL